MKLSQKIVSHIEEPQKWFKLLQRIIACVCILIPLILRLCDKDCFNPITVGKMGFPQLANCRDSFSVDTCTKKYLIGNEMHWIIKDCRTGNTIITTAKIKTFWLGFRESVSSYAYSSNGYLFGMLYCMAAMLFIYNGVLHIKILKNKARFKSANLNANGAWYYVVIGCSLMAVLLCPVHGPEMWHYIFTVIFFGASLLAIIFLPNKRESKKARYIVAAAAAILLLIAVYFKAVLWGEWLSLTVISIHLFFIADSANVD